MTALNLSMLTIRMAGTSPLFGWPVLLHYLDGRYFSTILMAGTSSLTVKHHSASSNHMMSVTSPG